jgi:hypothetical protein
VYWYKPEIPATRRKRQEDHEFETSFVYVAIAILSQ